MNSFFVLSNNYGTVVARDSLGSRFSHYRGLIRYEKYIDENLIFKLLNNTDRDLWISFNGITGIPEYDSVELICAVFEDYITSNYDVNRLTVENIVEIFYKYIKNIFEKGFTGMDHKKIKSIIYIFYCDKIKMKVFEISYPELLESETYNTIEQSNYYMAFPKYFISDFVEKRYSIKEIDERYLNNKTEEEKKKIKALFSSMYPVNIENLTIKNMIDFIKLNFLVFKECNRILLSEEFYNPAPYTFLIFRPGKKSEKNVFEDIKI